MKRVVEILTPLVVAGLIAWASWLTSSIYAGDKQQAVTGSKIEAVDEKVRRIEEDVKEIKKEQKEQNQTAQRNQTEMMRILMDIKRSTQ